MRRTAGSASSHEGTIRIRPLELTQLTREIYDDCRVGTSWKQWKHLAPNQRETWKADVRVAWNGGRSIHPLEWVREIVERRAKAG